MHAVELPLPTPPPDGAQPPLVLVSAPEGGRSRLVESLRLAGLGVLVTPRETQSAHVASGVVDLVLVHRDERSALVELQELRRWSRVPIVVTLREARAGLETFLEAGADDCVVAGVSRGELAARLRAVLRRRSRPVLGEVLRSGPFLLDLGRHVFQREDQVLHLPPKEFGLLELLIRRDGRVVSREEALQLVWGERHSGDPTTVDVHVKRLRSKIEDDPAHPTRLLTVRGLGYRFQG